MQPRPVSEEVVELACEKATKKSLPALELVRFTLNRRISAQLMIAARALRNRRRHRGCISSSPTSDRRPPGKHREIYLSDANRTTRERFKTMNRRALGGFTMLVVAKAHPELRP